MCDTWLAARRRLGCKKGEHRGWSTTAGAPRLGGLWVCMVNSPAWRALGEMGVIYFQNPDGTTAGRTVDCSKIYILERNSGSRQRTPESHFLPISLPSPWLLRRAGQEGDTLGCRVQALRGTAWRSSNSHRCYQGFCVGVCVHACVCVPTHTCVFAGNSIPNA